MNVTQKKNMANKPVDETVSVVEVDYCGGKYDYVILPNPFSIMRPDDLMDFSDRTGIGTCSDYIKRGSCARQGQKSRVGVAIDIISLITSIDLGKVKTPTVVCAQCHGLPQEIQELLMCGVTELHERGINVIIVKDGIEFRAEEKTKSVVRRTLQHVGLLRAFESLLN